MKLRIPSLLTLIALIGSGCSGPTEPVAIASIQVTASTTIVASGATVQLTATTLDKNGKALTDRVVTWSSSNQTIATVSATGLVTAGSVLGGTAEAVTITASAEGTAATAALSITPVAVSRVVWSSDSLSLFTADSQPLTYTIEGAGGQQLTGRSAQVTAPDTTIMEYRLGRVVARRYLSAETRHSSVIVSVDGKADTVLIRINPFSVAKVIATAYDSAFFVNERKTIRPTVLSANNDTLVGRTVTLTSATNSIAKISGDTIIGMATGRSLITIAVDTARLVMVARVDTATTYTYPASLAEHSYPLTYITPTTSHADIVRDSCAVAPANGRITIPQSYLSTRPLPQLSATDQLRSDVNRGMRVKDVWDMNNAAYVRGCQMSIRDAFKITVTRLKELGADYLTVAPWTFGIVNATNSTWRIMNPKELQTSTMVDEDLRWAVAEAKARGLKIHWINQIQSLCIDVFYNCGKEQEVGITAVTVARFMGAYRQFMLNRASLLDTLGVDVMQVGCVCYFPTWDGGDVGRVYLDSLSALIPALKQVYRGKLRMGWNPLLSRYPTLLDNIDYLEHGTWSNLAPEQYNIATVDALAAEFFDNWECNVKRCNPDFTPQLAQKPAIWMLGSPSHGKTSRGSYEETFCTATIDPGAEDSAQCIQRTVNADFSLQANVIQAQLRAFQNQTTVPVYSFELGDYWPVDKVDPTTSFPNIAYSPRNKPAEALLKHWFRR